jgi:hypothetical protein
MSAFNMQTLAAPHADDPDFLRLRSDLQKAFERACVAGLTFDQTCQVTVGYVVGFTIGLHGHAAAIAQLETLFANAQAMARINAPPQGSA